LHPPAVQGDRGVEPYALQLLAHTPRRHARWRPLPTAPVAPTHDGSGGSGPRNGATSSGCDSTLSMARTPPGRSTRTGWGHHLGYSTRSAARESTWTGA